MLVPGRARAPVLVVAHVKHRRIKEALEGSARYNRPENYITSNDVVSRYTYCCSLSIVYPASALDPNAIAGFQAFTMLTCLCSR